MSEPTKEELRKIAKGQAFTIALVSMRLNNAALVAVGHFTREQFVATAASVFDGVAEMLKEGEADCMEGLANREEFALAEKP